MINTFKVGDLLQVQEGYLLSTSLANIYEVLNTRTGYAPEVYVKFWGSTDPNFSFRSKSPLWVKEERLKLANAMIVMAIAARGQEKSS